MSIDIIRANLLRYLNLHHVFLYIGTRGIFEKFPGRIVKIYPRTFLIETDQGFYKSFSYSDFLIQVLRIIE